MRPIRWPLAALAVAAVTMVAATTTPSPGSGSRDTARAPIDCDAAPSPAPAGGQGAWWRLDPILDARGALVGQTLEAGLPHGLRVRTRLAQESFASGPVSGLILYGTDDGRRSRLALLDLVTGCSHPVASERRYVVRRAVFGPSAGEIYEFRVDRRTRRDGGVWRRPLASGAATARVLPPIVPDARFGITWTTELDWADDGRLVVTSCGASACRSRILDPVSGAVATVAEPDLGEPLGVAGGWYVAYLACRGLPCPIVAVDVASGDRTRIADAAGLAVLVTDDDGRARLVHESADESGLVVADPRGGRSHTIDDVGARLVPSEPHARSATAVPDGWLPVGADGRIEPGGGRLVRVRDGHSALAAEVVE